MSIDRGERTFTLCISCPDRVGIVARVSTFLAAQGGWILESNHHADAVTQRFFMRNVIRASSLQVGVDELRARFAPIAAEFGMDWRLSDSARPPRVVLLASRADHCLVDILHRWRSGDLQCEVGCVIANHPDLQRFVEWHGDRLPPRAGDARHQGRGLRAHRRPFRGCGRRSDGAGAVTCRSCRPRSARGIRAASSTSTTASCRPSSARTRITRPSIAA